MKALNLIVVLLAFLMNSIYAQDVLMTRNANVSFFSQTPVEDIRATNKTGASAINLKTGEIYFKVNITSFDFESKLMQEHFNENYMESDKYPCSEFKGKITDMADVSRPGTYNVNVDGKLTLHGVTKNYKVTAVIIN